MNEFTLSKFIEAPLHNVFSIFSDIDNAAEHISGILRIERLTNGPVGIGTRFKETRIFMEKEHSEEFEFIEFDPVKRYVVRAKAFGMEYTSLLEFRRKENGTQIDLSASIRPLTLKAKLATPFNRIMISALEKMLSNDLEDLKLVLESPAN